MPEQWSDLGSENSSGTVGNGSWSPNGLETEGAGEAVTAAATAEAGDAAEATEAERTEAAGAEAAEGASEALETGIAEQGEVAVATAESSSPEAAASTEPAPEVATGAVAESSANQDHSPAFLAELAKAMQATAAAERVRIGEDTERRRLESIDRIRARQAEEADRMRDLASEERRAIDVWAEGEMERIRLERERREAALNEDLETSLTQHGSKIDQEIERVEAAIAAYRTEVDTFFAGLDRETDVVQIARQATRRPMFPALDTVVAVEETATESSPAAIAEEPGQGSEPGDSGPAASPTPLVAVMDSEPSSESPGEPWAPPARVDALAEDATGEATGEVATSQDDEAVPVATATAAPESSSSIFQSVPVLRPMSWLRRDPNSGDRPTPED